MNRRRPLAELVLMAIAFIPIALCTLLPVLCLIQIYLVDSANQANAEKVCSQAPDGFSESDLIGTWGGSISKAWDSTIIIRGDGKYKQIVNVDWQKFNFESDWKTWRVVYSDKGLPYLHLEGFLMCAYWTQIDCRSGSPGFEPLEVGGTRDVFGDVNYWYDACQKKWADTPGEGVFMVIGTTAYYPRRIALVALTKSMESSDMSYQLREP